MLAPPPRSILFPYTTLFRSVLTGSLSVSTPGGDHVLSAEQGIEIAPRVPHHVRNTSDGTTHFLVASSPPSHGDRVVVDRKSTRLNSSHVKISYAVFCLKKKT